MKQLNISGWPQYLQPIADFIGTHYRYDSLLGEGKTGAAYKIVDQVSGRPFCLKTIAQKIESDKRADICETLRKEVEILDPLSHQMIPQVYERSFEGDLPFYVCTYHPGQTFFAFKQARKRLSTDKSIYVVQLLVYALRYLHERGRTHCDFHQNNIMLHDDVFTHGVLLIDFGSGHRESDTSDATDQRGDFRYKRPEDQARFRETVIRSKANSGFRSADFTALGHLLALMSECFFGEAPRDQQIAYREFCLMLENGQINDWDDASSRFSTVVDPARLITAADRFFISISGRREGIRIPVSNEVPVGEATLAVINSAEFQRLRGLKQLSFCDWTFPGATHSRFEHSLGVMQVTLAALRKLARNGDFRDRFTRQNVEGALLASLVHDIGHYPFAHLIEHYASSRFPEEREAREAVHHARHTVALLESNPELVSVIDRHWGEDVRLEAIKVLEGKIPVVSDLLDGPIDCDKLDYLRRDAHHCGVPFGHGIDVDAILESLCCVNNCTALGVLRSSVSAVEGLMIAQEQMLDAVYWHETIRGVMVMFHAIIATLVKQDINSLTTLVDRLKSAANEQYALRDVIIPMVENLPGSTKDQLRPLYQLHLEPRYTEIYRSIKQYTITDTPPNLSAARTSIYHTILKAPSSRTRSVPIDWDSVRRLRHCYRQAFLEKNSRDRIGDYEILVDVPWGKASNRMVHVVERSGEERAIVDVSHLDSTIFDQPTVYLAPIRVYVSCLSRNWSFPSRALV